MKRIIVGLGIPRVGTSHFCELLTNIGNLMTYSEVFHPHGAFGLQNRTEDIEELSNYAGIEFSSIFDEHLISWLHKHLGDFCDFALNRHYGLNKYLFFKVFPNQVDDDLIVGQLLQRQDILVVIFYRRPIDTCISDLTAIQMGVHREVDTTEFKLSLSIDEFMWWWLDRNSWYLKINSWIRHFDIPHVVVRYENDILARSDLTLLSFVKKCKDIGVYLNFDSINNGGLEKQNKQSIYKQKVKNWDVFLSQIRSTSNIQRLYNYFPDIGDK